MPTANALDAQAWLNKFSEYAAAGAATAIGDLFLPRGFWRDYLPFGWTLQTLEGRASIEQFAQARARGAGFAGAAFAGSEGEHEGFFRFQTNDGGGRGHIRLRDGKCLTLFTMLESLHARQQGNAAPVSTPREPFVLIVGGGQGGLALGAQLSDLGVPYLIVDKYPRIGDQWRSRYDSLVLHDPIWYDHMPFIPFPPGWPTFTPKDQMGDWLEHYAEQLSLNVWTSTELTSAQYDGVGGCWRANVLRDGAAIEVNVTHVVMALGLSGFPNTPRFAGSEDFLGAQLHSSEYRDGKQFAGKNVVIIGANNSAHDIACDLVRCGGQATMVQRSSTHVVRQSVFCDKLLGALYSAAAVASGITTEKADILQASMPLRLMEPAQKSLWDGIRQDEHEFYSSLAAAGFAVDFAQDGTGLGMKYRRTASGYYIDVGGAQMVIDGAIKVRSGSGVSHLSEEAIHLESGEAIAAHAIIYATGYGNMTDWVAKLIGIETAQRVGPCWGYGSGTRGDPEPWVGELRNMWVPTAEQGLWFTGGNLSQARFYSRLLGLQLAKRYYAAR